MTFDQIVTEVIGLRFNNNFVTQVGSWVNTRYALVWNAEDWTFRYATASPTTTGGTRTLGGLPTTLQRINYLYDENGTSLTYLPPLQFFANYADASEVGPPVDYTVVNGVVYLGPTPDHSATFTALYEQRCVPMASGDTPLLPVEYHYILVHGALATGMTTQNDFTYAQQEEMFQELLMSMRNAYTSDYGGSVQFQADSIGKSAGEV